LGIIGRNGAGKSTLLKVLSRITAPTTGRVELRGRVGSLLEVGTGFHAELTGRENVYLNGSILGMSRREIQQKFDEIVDFSGVEKFLDMPVKRYSSGMYVRLAFAVAAHLEPEILIVDEVLAVGDAEFQKKCLGKIGDVAKSGRTVLFVSHNMAAVESLCSRCVLLSGGRLEQEGTAEEVISQYLKFDAKVAADGVSLLSHPGRPPAMNPVMQQAFLVDAMGNRTNSVAPGEQVSIYVSYSLPHPIDHLVLGVVVKTLRGAPILGANNNYIPGFQFTNSPPQGVIACHFPSLPLVPGSYLVDLWLGDSICDLDHIAEAMPIEILPRDLFGSGKLPPAGAGPVYWPATFSINGTC
jgi:lipopolysaccharide transport system ATP-binding protein